MLHQERLNLEGKLGHLTQQVSPDERSSHPLKRSCALATAELYRLAALLYLQRVSPMVGDDVSRAHYLYQAYGSLEILDVASSPWPIYVIACESRLEEQRMTMLRILQDMERTRNVGNIEVMRKLVEFIWKQNDLQADSVKDQQLPWWNSTFSDSAVPWFA